ncbi:MAG: hypothetical protein ACRC4W_04215 [Treponemataceae bacterium]
MRKHKYISLFFIIIASTSLFAKGARDKKKTTGEIKFINESHVLIFDSTLPEATEIQQGFEQAAKDLQFKASSNDINTTKDTSVLLEQLTNNDTKGIIFFTPNTYAQKAITHPANITNINIYGNEIEKTFVGVSIESNIEETARLILESTLHVSNDQYDFAIISPSTPTYYSTELEKSIRKQYSLLRKKHRNVSLVKSKIYKKQVVDPATEFAGLIKTYPKIKIVVCVYPPDILEVAKYIETKNMQGAIFLAGLADKETAEPFFDKQIIFSYTENIPFNTGYLAGYLSRFFLLNSIETIEEKALTVENLGIVNVRRISKTAMAFYPPTIFHGVIPTEPVKELSPIPNQDESEQNDTDSAQDLDSTLEPMQNDELQEADTETKTTEDQKQTEKVEQETKDENNFLPNPTNDFIINDSLFEDLFEDAPDETDINPSDIIDQEPTNILDDIF